MPAVTFDGVTKIYGEETVALRDVSVEIGDGDFVVLLGPSGAGKSTFLRVLNGLTEPTEGAVTIDGRPAGRARNDVGMVFQEHYLIEGTSAFRNALTGALSRTGLVRSLLTWHDETDKRVALGALDTVGLLDSAGQRAGSMSGGQKQRVGIARALVQQPDLLLADEPVASLDPKAAREVMGYMRRAAEERDLTAVASLHQVEIARAFGERFLGIRNGEVVFDGRREDLTMDVVDGIYYGEGGRDGDPPAGPGTARDGSGSARAERTDGTVGDSRVGEVRSGSTPSVEDAPDGSPAGGPGGGEQ